jgi:hypothetical protein
VTITLERTIDIEAVRTVAVRHSYGSLRPLANDLRDSGLRHPVMLWRDNTLISGSRRHRAHLLLGARHIQAVFVDTIEDAAKLLLADSEDDHLALPMKPSETARFWEVLRRLDAPAAAVRAHEARQRGIELRRQTMDGKRKPGRVRNPSEDYVLSLVAPAFGLSESTARRLWSIHSHAFGLVDTTDEKSEQARQALKDIDAGESTISANHIRLLAGAAAPTPASRLRRAGPDPAPAARQRVAWSKSLPQMEGLVAGLAELGPPNADLTWEQVEPVYTRLAVIRRELEKMIKQMRETNKP